MLRRALGDSVGGGTGGVTVGCCVVSAVGASAVGASAVGAATGEATGVATGSGVGGSVGLPTGTGVGAIGAGVGALVSSSSARRRLAATRVPRDDCPDASQRNNAATSRHSNSCVTAGKNRIVTGPDVAHFAACLCRVYTFRDSTGRSIRIMNP